MIQRHLDQAHRTISTWAFKLIVLHHLSVGTSLSVIRMQDVEAKIMQDIADGADLGDTIQGYSPELIAWSGLTGITYGEVARRMRLAVQGTDYFAPSLSGLIRPDYDLMQYFDHPRLVDNGFAAAWSSEDRREILEAAHTVLIIHGNTGIGDHFQRTLTYHRAGYLKLSNWDQAEKVIEQARAFPHRLVLFAGSAGAKYIGPAIAKGTGKVVIDVGVQMERWLP